MNFEKILKQQKLLDQAIKEAHGNEGIIQEKKLIALFTEIGEFANEVQTFKYWKKSKSINEQLMLEEYADGLHFLLSFAIETNVNSVIESLVVSNDVNIQILEMYQATSELIKKVESKRVEKAIAVYLGIAKLLNISEDQIIKAYMFKNQKNFDRIKSNY